MNSPSPQIGFDRFIQLDWAAAALRVRLGTATIEELSELLDASHSGPAAKKKTRTVLNRLWLEPLPDLVEFADRGDSDLPRRAGYVSCRPHLGYGDRHLSILRSSS